jgi:hypothetical protein
VNGGSPLARDTPNASLFGSDFKNWYHIGRQPGFETAHSSESGACPSVFPLPRPTDSSMHSGDAPTHCFMHTTHANGASSSPPSLPPSLPFLLLLVVVVVVVFFFVFCSQTVPMPLQALPSRAECMLMDR